MKTLFVGEGRCDIGDPNPNPYFPRPAQGTIPTLAQRVCPGISSESIAIAWTEIRRFNPAATKRGFPAKVTAAALLSDRKFGCTATVVVSDQDGEPNRAQELIEGVERARELFPRHLIAWGLAVQSVEAWTLGVPEEIAAELELDVAVIRKLYPAGVHIEAMSEHSGKEDHRPKRLLQRILDLKHRSDSTEFRQAVAEKTDPATLEKECPLGFAPFAKELKAIASQAKKPGSGT